VWSAAASGVWPVTTQVGTGPAFGAVDRHVIDRTAVISYENPFSGNDWLDLRISASSSDTTVDQKNSNRPTPSPIFNDSIYGYRTWQFNVENTSAWYGDNWENHLTYGWQTAYQIRSAEATNAFGREVGIGFHPEGSDLKSGIFVQNEFVWDDRLTLIPGIRLDWRRLNPDDMVADAEKVNDFAFSPKLAAHYKLNDNLAVFGSIAHTERFPTLDEIYSNDFNPPALPNYSLNLEKERSNNFELGFAASGQDLFQAGDAAQIKVTGFYNDIRDLIARQRNQYPQYVNVGRAEIYGAEIEVAYDADYIFAEAGYSHVVGKDKDTGRYLTSVAPHELSLTLGGKLPDYGLRFGWKARFVAAPQDGCRRSDDPVVCAGDSSQGSTRFAKSFDVHDVFLTWKPEDGQFRGWEAQLGVENIFDKLGVSSRAAAVAKGLQTGSIDARRNG
jgi:hemoglobin/transferrin/lactoferrin receptor protein